MPDNDKASRRDLLAAGGLAGLGTFLLSSNALAQGGQGKQYQAMVTEAKNQMFNVTEVKVNDEPRGSLGTTAGGLLIQGGVVNKSVAWITVNFGQAFAAPPIVQIQPYWYHQNNQVGYIETLSVVTESSFTVGSLNAAANYYIMWLAIGNA